MRSRYAGSRGEAPCFTCNCGEHSWAPSTRGNVAIVSAEDAGLLRLNHWCARADGYADSRRGRLHQVVMPVKPGQNVDHINGNRHDARRSNLRECTPQQNHWNQRLTKRNKSGFKGVFFERRTGKWFSTITHEGRSIYLGTFTNKIEAARAYNAAAKERFGEFAWLNQV